MKLLPVFQVLMGLLLAQGARAASPCPFDVVVNYQKSESATPIDIAKKAGIDPHWTGEVLKTIEAQHLERLLRGIDRLSQMQPDFYEALHQRLRLPTESSPNDLFQNRKKILFETARDHGMFLENEALDVLTPVLMQSPVVTKFQAPPKELIRERLESFLSKKNITQEDIDSVDLLYTKYSAGSAFGATRVTSRDAIKGAMWGGTEKRRRRDGTTAVFGNPGKHIRGDIINFLEESVLDFIKDNFETLTSISEAGLNVSQTIEKEQEPLGLIEKFVKRATVYTLRGNENFATSPHVLRRDLEKTFSQEAKDIVGDFRRAMKRAQEERPLSAGNFSPIETHAAGPIAIRAGISNRRKRQQNAEVVPVVVAVSTNGKVAVDKTPEAVYRRMTPDEQSFRRFSHDLGKIKKRLGASQGDAYEEIIVNTLLQLEENPQAELGWELRRIGDRSLYEIRPDKTSRVFLCMGAKIFILGIRHDIKSSPDQQHRILNDMEGLCSKVRK